MNGKTGVRRVGLVGSWHYLKGFCRALYFPEGKLLHHVDCWCAWACAPGQHCGEVAKTGLWLLHGCTFYGSSGRVSAREPEVRSNKGCIVWKTTLAGCLALERLASKLESCPQPSPLSVRKFYRSWKPAMSFFFFHCALPLYAAAHIHCPHPSCFGSVARLSVSPGRLVSASNFSVVWEHWST